MSKNEKLEYFCENLCKKTGCDWNALIIILELKYCDEWEKIYFA